MKPEVLFELINDGDLKALRRMSELPVNQLLTLRVRNRTLEATLLEKALWRHEDEIVCFLLERGADPNKHTPTGTPLGLAISEGNITAAMTLLEYGADLNAYCYREPALHEAAANSDVAMLQFLLERGADLHVRGIENPGVLHAVAASCRSSMMNEGPALHTITLLLKHGAATNLRDAEGLHADEIARWPNVVAALYAARLGTS